MNDDGEIGQFDIDTGVATSIATLPSGYAATGLARLADGRILAVNQEDFATAPMLGFIAPKVHVYDPSSNSFSTLGLYDPGLDLSWVSTGAAVDETAGVLYLLVDAADLLNPFGIFGTILVEIDLDTGAVLGTTMTDLPYGTCFGLYLRDDGVLITTDGSLVAIDPLTGDSTIVASLAVTDGTSIAEVDGQTYLLGGGSIYELDPYTGSTALVQTSPGYVAIASFPLIPAFASLAFAGLIAGRRVRNEDTPSA